MIHLVKYDWEMFCGEIDTQSAVTENPFLVTCVPCLILAKIKVYDLFLEIDSRFRELTNAGPSPDIEVSPSQVVLFHDEVCNR